MLHFLRHDHCVFYGGPAGHQNEVVGEDPPDKSVADATKVDDYNGDWDQEQYLEGLSRVSRLFERLVLALEREDNFVDSEEGFKDDSRPNELISLLQGLLACQRFISCPVSFEF